MVRILIVDDYEDSAKLIGKLLSRHGYETQTHGTGKDVVHIAEAFKPHVILCDIGLPDIDGYQVARRIKAHEELRSTLLIAVTGYVEESDRRASLEAGFDAHLAKPIDVQRLRETIDSLATVCR